MLFFDIETKAKADTLRFMDEPNAPSNYKDPIKIQQYIENKKQEQIEKAALDADFGTIVAIGMKINDEKVFSIIIEENDVDAEVDMIHAFWRLLAIERGRCCGYNILNFDLPYLMRRSFDLGIKLPIVPNLSKYNNPDTLDLMAILYNWTSFKSLKWVAERYALDNPLPELSGEDVKNMDNDILRKYVENDVYLVYQLYQRMNGIYFIDKVYND